MEQMAARLSFDLALIPEVLEQLGREGPELTRSFFKVCLAGLDNIEDMTFSQIWQRAVKTASEGLSSRGKETLVQAGSIIGRYSLEAQLGALMGCVARLKSLADSAAVEGASKIRVYAALGVCSGLMAVLVLI